MTYLEAFESDTSVADEYLLKSVREKTQQQIRLEEILISLQLDPQQIADICCGAGGLSLHLSKLYPAASFTLVDLGDHAIGLAQETARSFTSKVLKANALALPIPDNSFDLVFCWQTLSWISSPYHALAELLRICKPGGYIFLSALFNTDYDVDLYVEAVDYTRTPVVAMSYTTFNSKALSEFVKCDHKFHDFPMPIDLPKATRGLGTHTVRLEDGSRLQISGGMMMNWKILEIRK